MGRLVYFGNERLANAVDESGVILSSLIDAGHEVTNVVINRAERTSRKKKEDAVVKIAHTNGINVIDTWDEQHIIDLAADHDAGVLASFGRILKDPVINAFEHGIVNIHPSLLPEFRGPTPIESAILGGLDKTGVSLMALDSQMDAGNIYAQAEHHLHDGETKQELYETLAELGADLLTEHLDDILSGKNTGKEQDHHLATITKLIIKSDGLVDWDQSATTIERQIRAFAGWPSTKATIAGHELTLTQASVTDAPGTPGEYDVIDKNIVVACGEGSLVIEKLKPAGKGEMTTEAFLAGHKV